MNVRVYTDGACSGNPGPGGWAWATTDGQSASGADPDSTNQRMELQAVLEAVRALEGPLEIYSDSTYVVNCFNDKWYEGWLKRNWKNSQKKPVANREIWEPLIDEYLREPDRLAFHWVKGHSGDKMNDLVDALAVAEVSKLKANNTADNVLASIEVPWPVDKAVAVVGAGTVDLANLQRSIEDLNPDSVVVSGLRRGVELNAAEHALATNRQLGVVLPFADPVKRWAKADQQRFEAALDSAAWVVNLDRSRTDPKQALMERNAWLRSTVIAVLTGDADIAADFDIFGVSAIVI